MTVKAQFVQDYVVYNNKTFKGTDGLGKLCRELTLKHDLGNQKLECYRGSMLCLTIPKIKERAKFTLQDSDKRGLMYRKHRSFSEDFIKLKPQSKLTLSQAHIPLGEREIPNEVKNLILNKNMNSLFVNLYEKNEIIADNI